MMVKHIVMWNLKENAEGVSKLENAQKIKEGLEALVGKIEGLLSAEVGIGFNTNGYDLCLYSEFESKEALEFYQNHPLHDNVRQFVHKVISERVVCDYII